MQRRTFLAHAAGVAAALAAGPIMARREKQALNISLAQWSLNRRFFGKSREAGFAEFFRLLMSDPDQLLQGDDPLLFPQIAREEFGIDAVEYVNTFYFSRAGDEAYLEELARRAGDAGVASRLIMCDALGQLGAAEPAARAAAIENHKPWLSAAEQLGCHAIRVNVDGEGTREAVADHIVEALSRLGELAAAHKLSVLVENHGGLSSDAGWLADVMSRVGRSNVGTLPDFGNFRLLSNATPRGPDDPFYDRYQGVAELMPYAHAVSAKSYDFDDAGAETTIDYERMLAIVHASGYEGDVGIEYEGNRLSEADGIRATKALLERHLSGA